MSGPKLFDLFFCIHSWAFGLGIYVYHNGWPRFWAQLGPVTAAIDLSVFHKAPDQFPERDFVS